MTQLALLLVLGLLGLVLSLALGRLEVKRGVVAPTVRRIEGAVERAATTLLRIAGMRALLLLLVPALGLSVCALVLAKPGGVVSPGGRAAFLCVALLGGGSSSYAQARLTVALGARACSAATSGAGRSSVRALRPLLRASAGLAGFGEGLGLLGVALAFAVLYAVRGGFAQAAASAELASEVVRLLPAFALGAAVTALELSREGSALAAAVLVGGSQTSEREAQLDALDPRNPATLADRLGEQVGGLLPQTLASYVTGVSATVAAALLAVAVSRNPEHSENPLTCLLLILAVRAFGIVGSLCGVFAARADETESPELALRRGQLSASAVAAFGLGAGLYWLRVQSFVPLLLAGFAGLVATALVTQLVWLPLRRTSSTARELAEARSLGEGAAIARGVGAGLSCLLPALLIPALGLWLVERAPNLTGHAAASQALLVAAFVAGLLATAPFSMAVAGFGSLCDAAQGFGALARLELEPRRAGARLEEASSIGGGGAATHASLALTASLLFGLFTLRAQPPAGAPLELELPGVLTGIALVLLFGARASRSALLGARAIAEEVRRQLAGLPRRQGALAVPPDFTPSYKACVDSALDEARSGSLLAPALALLVPFGMVAALLGAASSRGALLGFATATVLAGLTFTLGSRATRAALREARRRTRGSEAAGQATVSHNFGDLVGVGAAASVEALASALALTVLSLASLLG